MQTEPTMRIVELRANNFKRLKAVRIKPCGNLVRIEGRNAQGKSSVLDAIEAALGGARHSPEVPIRNGTNKATIIADLGELIVERTFTTKGGPALEVRTKDGVPQKSPQAILDKLLGDLGFDPEGFVRLKPADQLLELKRLVGLDFADLDAERESIYHQRKAANVELKSATASLGDPPVVPVGLPDTRQSITDLAAEFQAASKHNEGIDALRTKIVRAENVIVTIRANIDRLTKELAEQNQRLADGNTAISNGKAELDAMEPKDVGAISERMASIESTNALIDRRAKYKEGKARVESLEAKVEAMTAKIEGIDQAKRERLESAKFPIEGLSLDDTGPTLKGLPFAQASGAEQLRASVAIAMAQNPRLRVILVRDGSRLDQNSMKLLAEIAAEHDAQVFVERVADERSPAAVVIEDGEVVSEPEATA